METWTIDQAHSEVGFSVKHLIVSTVRGRFGTFEGSLSASNPELTDAKVEFSADVASITTNNAMRDGHLQSPEFFDAAQFPKVTFVSKSFDKTGDNTYKMVGDFTMKGVTKEIALDVVANGMAKNMQGKSVASFDVSGTIKRTDFGVNWNQVLEAGGLSVSEDVTLNATVELQQG
jgi:polyisoprenoid-binding protein YceI